MFKKIALLALVSTAAALPSTSFAYLTCSESNQINAACDYVGDRGYCNKSTTSPTGWVCQKDPVASEPVPEGREVEGGGGDADYFEVVECVYERGSVEVEINPMGTSGAHCDTLFEFSVNDESFEFIGEETIEAAPQEYRRAR